MELAKGRTHSGRLRAFIIGSSALILAATTSAVAVASSSSPHELTGGGTTSLAISGVKGEGGSGLAAGSIAIDSWSWGAYQSQSSGAGAGKVKFNEFSITRRIDSASPGLFQACASGATLATVVLTLSPPPPSGAAPGDTLVITFSRVHVASYSTSSSGGERPVESISFNFTKIQMDYHPQSTSAVVHSGWDLATGKKA